jgi:hypothetical protein
MSEETVGEAVQEWQRDEGCLTGEDEAEATGRGG